jgi:hypothetical protein
MAARPDPGAPIDLIATHGYGDSSAVWPPLLAALGGLARRPAVARFLERNG